ncbi:hypothetical protein D7030_15025 [Flavobacteriaceae bacterium AU392]|nr:hypothetical protein D1817_03465 [Flavobacteriaceae bacterium]RKM81607.1 hypothetical protein D7030_15025 [Flavobacteriaceae bacterium AU392]
MKQHKPILSIFIVLFLLLAGCTQDDTPLEIAQEEQEIFQTANSEDVLNLFKPLSVNTESIQTETSYETSETNNSAFVIPDVEQMTQEELINSDQLITVIPATTPTIERSYSRMLAINVNGELQTIVFTMIPNQSSTDDEFNGKYYVNDLEGNLINEYNVEDGLVVDNISTEETIASSVSQSSTIEELDAVDVGTAFNTVINLDLLFVDSRGPDSLSDLDNAEPVMFFTGGGGSPSGDDNNPTDCSPGFHFDRILNRCVADQQQLTTDEKNCNDLNALIADATHTITPPATSVKSAINNLKGFADNNLDIGAVERGSTLNHSGSLTQSARAVPNGDLTRIRYTNAGIATFGAIHLHPNNGVAHPMFSAGDIFNLFEFSRDYNNGVVLDFSIFTLIVVTSQGEYALKINDPIKFSRLGAIFATRNDEGDSSYKKFIRRGGNAYGNFQDARGRPNGGATSYEEAFLEFLEDEDLGISLHKASDDLSGWTKLTLSGDAFSPVTDTPCN